jgi:endonuclease/exonuclease/phosphatase (EEP) superfamily protein YafD
VARQYLWASAIALLAMITACGSAPLEPREPTPGAFHFTLQTFNVEVGKDDDPATVAAVGAADADILCLQETGAGWPDALRKAYAKRYPHQLYLRDPEGHPSSAMAVLSRFPLIDRGVIDGPGDWHAHPAWRVDVTTPRATLQILHVHLRATFSGGSNALAAYMDVGHDHRTAISHFTNSGPGPSTLIVGDFNEESDGDAVKKLKDEGYRDALPLFKPGQATWRHPSLADQFTAAIDHILFDDSLEPLDARVLVKGNSDHLPLVAHFELAGDP